MSNSKVILITGGSSGIGAATARLAIAAGYQVVVTGRSKNKLDVLTEEFGTENFLGLQMDVSDFEAQQETLKQTISKFNKLDVVFANAGISKGERTFKGNPNPEDWKEMVLTNVYGVALTIQTTLPEIIKTKGRILLTGSVVGRYSPPGSLYSATKWAITGLAESVRKEVVGDGVGVTLVEPGIVETEFWPGKNVGDRPALSDVDVAKAVMFILDQPQNVVINELLMRPIGQDI